MAMIKPFPLVFGLIVLFLFAKPTLAFGAGNIAGISKVEGVNCKTALIPRSSPPLRAILGPPTSRVLLYAPRC